MIETAGKVERFFKAFPIREKPAKHDLVLAGDRPKYVYYLVDGRIRQYDISAKNGAEVTIHIYEPGSFFPLTWALAEIKNRYFYQTLTPVKFHAAPRERFIQFFEQNSDLGLELARRLLHGLDGLSTRIKYLILGDAHQKIYAELLYLVRHFAVTEGDEAIIALQFTHQNIADLTGMARETVSHILADLHRQGVISDTHQHIIIHDLKRLRDLAEL